MVSCPVCNCPLATRFLEVVDPQSREIFQIVACPVCGHGCTAPVPADIDRYYGPSYHGGRHGFTANHCARRRLKRVGQVTGAGDGRRLLDVGCGDGAFMLHARRSGWQVLGTELNADLARQAGLRVCRSLAEAVAEGPFDCITMWHVLEHLADPLAELKSIHDLLAADGVLLLAVPDARGIQALLWGPSWLHLDVPRHLHHFSRRSLELHLGRAGFAVERVWQGEFEYDLLGWSQSALNRLTSHPNLFFETLTGRDKPARGTMSGGKAVRDRAAGGKRLVHLLLGTLFSGAALLPTWWGMLAGGAGALTLAANKSRVADRVAG